MFHKRKFENVYTSIFPLYIFLKTFSLFIPSNFSEGNLKISLIDKIWFFTWNLVVIILIVLNFRNGDDKNLKDFSVTALNTASRVGLLCCLLILFMQFRKSKDLVKLIQMFNDFDEKVGFLKLNKFYHKF